MFIELDKFSPDVKIGIVSASRNCFPRELSEKRTERLLKKLEPMGIDIVRPAGRCSIIESKDDALTAADLASASGLTTVNGDRFGRHS